MFDVPGSDISTVIVTEDAVRGEEAPSYVRSQRAPTPDVVEEAAYEEEELKVQNNWSDVFLILSFSCWSITAYLFIVSSGLRSILEEH